MCSSLGLGSAAGLAGAAARLLLIAHRAHAGIALGLAGHRALLGLGAALLLTDRARAGSLSRRSLVLAACRVGLFRAAGLLADSAGAGGRIRLIALTADDGNQCTHGNQVQDGLHFVQLLRWMAGSAGDV